MIVLVPLLLHPGKQGIFSCYLMVPQRTDIDLTPPCVITGVFHYSAFSQR